MQVLHLFEHRSSHSYPTAMAVMHDALGRLGDMNQSIVLIGPSSLEHAARAMGIEEFVRISAALNHPVLAMPALRRAARRLPAPTIVHCWSIGTLAAATLLWRHHPRLLSLLDKPSPAEVRWLRAMCPKDNAHVAILAGSSIVRQALISGGVPEKCVHLLRPAADMGRIEASRRAALRERWHVGPTDTVVALLSNRPQEQSALGPMLACNIATSSVPADAPAFSLLMHTRQKHRLRARQMMRALGRPHLLLEDDDLDHPWRVLSACDVALAVGEKNVQLSLMWAMAANVTIVGEATYAVSELLEDRHSALLARPDDPKLIAQRLVQLREDPQLAWQLRDTARHEAFSFFSRQRYCQSLRTVYQQVAGGQIIDVPPLPVTGGLRFSGRA